MSVCLRVRQDEMNNCTHRNEGKATLATLKTMTKFWQLKIKCIFKKQKKIVSHFFSGIRSLPKLSTSLFLQNWKQKLKVELQKSNLTFWNIFFMMIDWGQNDSLEIFLHRFSSFPPKIQFFPHKSPSGKKFSFSFKKNKTF